jgi:hypothetical protein
VRRLLVGGFSLLAIAALLLTRVPAGVHYATDLLPVLILAGLAGGLSAPAIQIGALSGVPHSMTGLAGGLVETLREIGGALGVAAVSTVLASRAGEINGAVNPSARRLATTNAFHAAFWVMFVVAALGVLTAAIAFPRRTTQAVELEPGSSEVSIVPEPDASLTATRPTQDLARLTHLEEDMIQPRLVAPPWEDHGVSSRRIAGAPGPSPGADPRPDRSLTVSLQPAGPLVCPKDDLLGCPNFWATVKGVLAGVELARAHADVHAPPRAS